MVYSARRFVVCLSVCHFVLVVFSPFCIRVTSLGEEKAYLSAFRMFVRFVLVWICRFHFVLLFFNPFSIAITSLGEERAYLSAFRTFVRFVLV